MLGLYHILMQKESADPKLQELKRHIYNNIYMDNGSFSTDEAESIEHACQQCIDVFGEHKFELQQFATNVQPVQDSLDVLQEAVTPDIVKLFGMNWCRSADSLSPYKINLDTEANTKRRVLSTLNAVYDVFGIYIPLLLRAKLFMQRLQEDKNLKWDVALPEEMLLEWRKIAKQANDAPAIELNRCIGSRDSKYALIALTDSSQDAYGVIIYAKEIETGKVSFLTAKNRILNRENKKKDNAGA